ncbi:MAG: hypothetical protein SPF41_00445, partial [Candidatus Merdousia sp.]|nr:hypothetical protein [Candidatus Merdousia sp.]
FPELHLLNSAPLPKVSKVVLLNLKRPPIKANSLSVVNAFFQKNLFFSKKYFQAVKELFQISSLGLNLKRPLIKASRHHLVNTFFEVFFNQSIFF